MVRVISHIDSFWFRYWLLTPYVGMTCLRAGLVALTWNLCFILADSRQLRRCPSQNIFFSYHLIPFTSVQPITLIFLLNLYYLFHISLKGERLYYFLVITIGGKFSPTYLSFPSLFILLCSLLFSPRRTGGYRVHFACPWWKRLPNLKWVRHIALDVFFFFLSYV